MWSVRRLLDVARRFGLILVWVGIAVAAPAALLGLVAGVVMLAIRAAS